MPRACPVEHSRSPLLSRTPLHGDATGLSRGVSRSPLLSPTPLHGDATGLSRGVSRSPLLSSTPLHGDATGLSRGVSRSLLLLAATARCYCSLLRFASSLANLSIYFRICGFDKSPYEPMYALFIHSRSTPA